MSRSSFSNFGPCVDILTPGSPIESTASWSNVRTTKMSGTSMAAPHVAGAAALILEANPEMTPVEVLARLVENSQKDGIFDAKSDNYFLWVGSGDPPAPTPPTPPPLECPWYCLGTCLTASCQDNCSFCQE